MCLRKTDVALKNKEHSGSGHAKASPSGSVHKTPFTSESFILLREFALFPISGIRFRTSGKRRKSSFSLRVSVPCVTQKQGTHFMRHSRVVFCPLGRLCSNGVFVSSLPDVHARTRLLYHIPSELQRHLEIPSRRRLGYLSTHARPNIAADTCWWEKSSLRHSFGPAANHELH